MVQEGRYNYILHPISYSYILEPKVFCSGFCLVTLGQLHKSGVIKIILKEKPRQLPYRYPSTSCYTLQRRGYKIDMPTMCPSLFCNLAMPQTRHQHKQLWVSKALESDRQFSLLSLICPFPYLHFHTSISTLQHFTVKQKTTNQFAKKAVGSHRNTSFPFTQFVVALS